MSHLNHSRRNLRAAWALFSWMLTAALFVSACGLQPAPKVYRVGILSGLNAFAPVIEGFKAGMTELGYIEGEDVVYDVQSTDVDMEAYQAISEQFVADKVDLILSFPTEASMVAKAAAQDTGIPVVFAMSFTDVEGIDLIDSVREPGGNITGVRFPSAEIAAKRLEILAEMVPDAKRILVPYLKDYPNVPGQLETIRPLAGSLGIELIEFAATSPPELQAELDRRAAAEDIGLDAVLMIAEPLGITPVFYDILAKFCYEHNLPIGGALMSDADGHASIFGLLPDAQTAGGQAAVLADKIFKGTPAGTIPVITAEGSFQINYNAAQALGVTVPEGLLKQADTILR